MKALAQLVWNEPAVAFGLLGSVAVGAVTLLNGGALTADDVLGMLAPLGAGLATRQAVTPVRAR